MDNRTYLACSLCLVFFGCGPTINYDKNYIWGEYEKCNEEPYLAVIAECKIEAEKGLENKPACEAKNAVDSIKSERASAEYFNPSLRKNRIDCNAKTSKEKILDSVTDKKQVTSIIKNSNKQSNSDINTKPTANKIDTDESNLVKNTSQPKQELSGVWSGMYQCVGQSFGMALYITNSNSEETNAVFYFYPTEFNPGNPSGCFSMKGKASNNKLKLDGEKWLLQPKGFEMIGLSGEYSQKVIQGKVLHNSCSEFSLEKKEPPTPAPSECK